MITADDVSRGKPDPESYLAVLNAHGLDRAESVAIEDGEHGWKSARAAGIDVVTVHGGGFPSTPHARNFAELAELFDA
jgi:beta-phosphoglucomutase-like phosphatase (HAD superfamily)